VAHPPLRFGLIGCSSIAKRRFIPALLLCKNATLTGIGSRDPLTAAHWAITYQAPLSGSYQDILESDDIDCVYISLPTSLHYEWTLKALAKGKHVICEKPAVMSPQEATHVLEMAHTQKKVFLEALVPTFHSQHATVDTLIKEGKIGTPRYLSAIYTSPMPPDQNIRFSPQLGGGVFWDAMGYLVAQYLRLFTSPPLTTHLHTVAHPTHPVPIHATATLIAPTGESAHLFAGYGLGYQSTCQIVGTTGTLTVHRAYSIDTDMEAKLTLQSGRDTHHITLPPDDQFLNMITHFITRIHTHDITPKTDELFLRHYAVMDQLVRSELGGVL